MVPDYYAMLGIDPRCDRDTIERALARCQPAWSSGTRNPKTKHTFQSYLDQIPALRRALLGDPAARAAYDAELDAGHRIVRDAKLNELQRLIRLRSAKGGLTVSDRALLRTEAQQRGLTSEDLDRLVESVPPLPETPDENEVPETPIDLIDPAMRRQVRLALEHLRRRDLYHVLDLPRDTSETEILARADAERRRWMQKAHVTAEKTAWLEAISYAQSHLGNAAARARYDRTLVLEAEEAFGATVGFTIRGLNRLDPTTREVLVEEAAALGIAPDRAASLIRRGCRAEGTAYEETIRNAPPLPGPLLRCRICSGVTVAEDGRGSNAESCRHCGARCAGNVPPVVVPTPSRGTVASAGSRSNTSKPWPVISMPPSRPSAIGFTMLRSTFSTTSRTWHPSMPERVADWKRSRNVSTKSSKRGRASRWLGPPEGWWPLVVRWRNGLIGWPRSTRRCPRRVRKSPADSLRRRH